jgi:DNA polymerase-3 subunit delta'
MWQVYGQTRAVCLLENSLKNDNLAHAYLVVGPPHVGKMTLALNLAQALNCEAEERPCLKCASCQKIAASGHADVQIISLEKNEDATEKKLISVEQIEDMQHAASLPPYEGRHRVFIIDGAELLSIESANRLLKTLEEPVDRVTFILLTVNDRLLPTTVISRCQRLELAPLSITEAVEELKKNFGLDNERARLLAGLSHGCLGWAVSAVGDEGILEQRDEQLNGLIAAVEGDSEERFAYAARLATRFSQSRGEVYDVLELWLDYWRDLMLVRLGCRDMITNIDRGNELADMAKHYRLSQITSFIERIQSTAQGLRQNVNARLALEVLMLDIPRKEGGGEENLATRISVKYG